jgi:diguanylate cyclase (GGDEF)-like protein
MLLAPMLSEDGEMVGVISVDLPPGGRRPSQLLCELLELFAMQAGIAISAVELRDRYRRERAAREDLLVDLAHRDALTGLPNRRALGEALETSVRVARETGRPGAVLFCDLDGLKRLNDREGHARGDQVLVAWARELERRVREGDLVCRIGGDEFVVVANHIVEGDADAIAARLREEGPLPAEFGGLTLSVGVALLDGSEEAAELLRLADEAMYADKARRRGA